MEIIRKGNSLRKKNLKLLFLFASQTKNENFLTSFPKILSFHKHKIICWKIFLENPFRVEIFLLFFLLLVVMFAVSLATKDNRFIIEKVSFEDLRFRSNYECLTHSYLVLPYCFFTILRKNFSKE